MKVLFDNQVFDEQKIGGISRYISILATELPNYGVDTIVGAISTNNTYLKEVGLRKYFNFLPKRNKYFFKTISKYASYDVFHPTYYNPYTKYLKKRPIVLTVHDMIYELFSNDFDHSEIIKAQKQKMIVRADRIIAISENTKQDIINITGIDEKKIDVIHHGLMWSNNLQPQPIILPFSANYILFVGDRRTKYKCFKEFIIGVSEVVKKYGLHIIATGACFTQEELLFLKKYGVEKITHNYMANENQLLWLYQNATCFIFPSIYEGFGIPILEAFKSGCPTILSNSSCFPEIAQNSVMYFEAGNPESLSSTLTSLLDDNHKRANLRELGYERLKDFPISKMVEKTCLTYEKAV